MAGAPEVGFSPVALAKIPLAGSAVFWTPVLKEGAKERRAQLREEASVGSIGILGFGRAFSVAFCLRPLSRIQMDPGSGCIFFGEPPVGNKHVPLSAP